MAPSQGLSYKNGMPSRTGSSSRSRQLNEKLMIKSQMASTGLLKTPAYPSVDSQNYAGPGVHVKEDAWERQALVSKHGLLSSSRPSRKEAKEELGRWPHSTWEKWSLGHSTNMTKPVSLQTPVTPAPRGAETGGFLVPVGS